MGSYSLNSAAFSDIEVEACIGRMLNRLAKRFKQERKDDMAYSSHTGRIYFQSERGAGGRGRRQGGFRSYHQASRYGERPAPITFNLTNALKDEKTGGLSHRVYVDDQQAPYGKYLQSERLNRPIADLLDAKIFLKNADAQREIAQCKRELGATGGIEVFATTRQTDPQG
jgi:hypothetical protein